MVIGVDDALILAGIAAAGAGASYFGTKDTNSANAAMNRGAMKFQWDVNQWQMANQREMFDLSMGFNRWEAQRARDFAEYMSNTAYQRARRDMMAAGLNPILAYQQGGASTPPAASASISTPSASAHGVPSLHRMENALGPAVTSAMQAAHTVMGVQQAAAQIDQTKATTELAKAQQQQAQTQAALNSATAITEAQRTGLVKSQRATEMVMPSLRQAQSSAASAQAQLSREQAATEPDRRANLAGGAYNAWQQGRRAFIEGEQTRTYGQGGVMGVSPSAVAQPIYNAGEYIRRLFQ